MSVLLCCTEAEAEKPAGWVAALKTVLPNEPFVHTSDPEQVKLWLPLVDAVFLHQQSDEWVYDKHPQILVVVPAAPSRAITNTFVKNIRIAQDTFLLSEPDDVARLQARFAGSVIQEVGTT